MNVLDLFSGIGGFCLGFEQAGMRTTAFCEIDPFCRAVLHKHWPGIPVHANIRRIDGRQYRGTVDLVCGGYPCQPFSVAGLRRGASDERHLWPEMYRLIREIRPRWVVAENVAGHINLGFDEVAASLEAEDFTVWPFVIPACAVNAPHRRDRVWIIAHAARAGKRRKAGDFRQTHGRQISQLPQQPDRATTHDVSDAYDIGREGSIGSAVPGQSVFAQQPAGSFTQWAEGWPLSAPRICGVDDGIPNRTYRLKSLGNSIVPQIAALIGQAIVAFERCGSGNGST